MLNIISKLARLKPQKMKKSTRITKLFLLLNAIFIFTVVNAQDNFSKNYLVVRLNHKLLDLNNIDNSTFDNRNLIDYLNDHGKEQLLRVKDSTILFEKLRTVKLFSHIKTADSISISRTRHKVYVPPFWATFKIYCPNGTDFHNYMDKMKNLYPIVIYAHPDYYGKPETLPNDEYFGNQLSLYNFGVPNSSINIDSAWNIEIGKKHIKVGVFDSGIDSTHPDLSVLTGWGYYEESPHLWGIDSTSHGTSVAGIIGAKRNNGIGIAGIAGGDGSDSSGVSLIDFRIDYAGLGYYSATGASQGMIDAARSVGSYYSWNPSDLGTDPYIFNSPGYGLHITNHSYSMKTSTSIKKPRVQKTIGGSGGGTSGGEEDVTPEYPDCFLCRESFLFSLQNGVVNVVSRGNRSIFQPSIPTEGYEKYPYSYHDSWIISVGSSGLDGNWLDGTTNNSFNEAYTSFTGRDIDIIAPGTDSLIVTTKSLSSLPTNIEYKHFRGTSAAAPHAAGVAALLLSRYNKNCYSNINLDPADVEYILQESATDVEAVGYDDYAGWGRIDAFKALKMIDFPAYQIIHPENLPDTIILLENDTITLYLNKPFVDFAGGPIGSQFPLELNREYRVERRKYEVTYDFSQYILPTTQHLDTWVRHSQTNSLILTKDTVSTWQLIGLTGQYGWVMVIDTFRVEPMAEIASIDTINKKITMTGYYYHFIGKYEFGVPTGITQTQNYWYPIDPITDSLKMAYSIYIHDESLTSMYDFPCDSLNDLYDPLAEIGTINSFVNSGEVEMVLFPNPGNNLNVTLSGHSDGGKLQLINTMGQILNQINTNSQRKAYILNVENLKSGLYFVNISDQNGIIISKKWIKL